MARPAEPAQTPASPAAGPPVTYRRRTYLVDARFQLKYTGLLLAVVVVLMIGLGQQIGQSSNAASNYAQLAAAQAERAMKESRTSSKLARQSVIANAGDNPALLQIMEEELAATDRQAEKDLETVQRERAEVEHQRQETRNLLIFGGLGLTVALFVMGIFITSKVVGPVYKIKRLLRRVGTGRLVVKERLRRGDELEDLFDTFLQMTYSLKALESGRLATLEATLEEARRTGASHQVIDGLRALRAQMRLGLGGGAQPSMYPPPAPVPPEAKIDQRGES